MNGKFFWGASTSAHQVEGGARNSWTEWERANADRLAHIAKDKSWPEYILKNSPTPLQSENYISGRATGHYNRFEKDFDMAKNLGHNAHAFSLEWSRVEPENGAFDKKEIEHYRQVIQALRSRGMEPFVTLWHWTNPPWLEREGGVLAKKFPEYFERYAARMAGEFGSDVRFWMTVNEPEIFSKNSYLSGRWPPRRKSVFAFYSSMNRLARAHGRAARAIKRASADAAVGAKVDPVYFESAGWPVSPVLKFFADAAWNRHFLRGTRKTLDFIGINYYFHNRVGYWFNQNENAAVSDMGWEIYPEGLCHILIDMKKYGLPMYITENGIADARDEYRAKFIKDHISAMRKAMDAGADVRGYFHWSLLDNFEWDSGFWPRFGLIEVDYKTLERKPRQSAFEYAKIIEENAV